MSLNTCCSNFSESGHSVFCGTSALKWGALKKVMEVESCLYTSVVIHKLLKCFCTIISVNQLSVCGAVADMCDELASRISDCSGNTERHVAQDKSETMVAPTDFVDHDQPTSDQLVSAVRLAARIQTKNRKSSKWSSIDQIALRCRFYEDCRPRTVFRDPWPSVTGKIGCCMSRSHITSRWPIIKSKRMDPWKHEDLSSTGGNSVLPPRPLRNWDQNQLLLC